ncbi:hypothetical protein M3148_04325 [Georgenia satyanarayanai]|uniref:hypothetical protein n=1 Tax=Georgenia satyanarayanai TaxID=860221 RepID=UPI00203FECB3|nr:hypothetical protein [Georgenia satyanarayanai]MCM3660224.1 hypothetical protein [Georgenia satyanarayanai]
MRRRSAALSAAVLLTLAAGCSTNDEETLERPTDAAERDSEQVTACEAFYEGTGTPLAERAEAARVSLESGQVVDAATYTEVNALEQRLRELSRDAPPDMVPVLAGVAAPFTAAVTAVNEAGEQEVPEGEEPPFPDLTTIDVTEAAAAQGTLAELCSDAGYEAP